MVAIWDFLSQQFELFFYLQVTPMLPTKFQVNWPFSSEEEGKNRFSRWPPSWISDWNNFSYFNIFKLSRCFLPIFNQLALWFRKINEKSFRMATMVAILDFRSKQFKLFLNLHVTLMLPTKFRVKWPFSSGEEAKNRFSRWLSWRPSWISDRDDFSYFCSTGHLDASYLFKVNKPFGSGEEVEK